MTFIRKTVCSVKLYTSCGVFYIHSDTRQQPPVPLNLSLLKILDAIGKTDDPFLLLLFVFIIIDSQSFPDLRL